MINDQWIEIGAQNIVDEGRVTTVSVLNKTYALLKLGGKYVAMDDKCPHQGGPLGEGSIECGVEGKRWLRCPWHGWDFDPFTGRSPGAHSDGQQIFPIKIENGKIFIGLPKQPKRQRTISDVMVETMINWGVKSVFGMVGHSNLGLADAIREKTVSGEMHYYGIRHEGAAAFACSAYGKLTELPAACLTIAGPGATNLLTGLWDAKVDRAPVLALTGQIKTQYFGPGFFQEIDLPSAFHAVARFSQTVLPSSNHAELTNLACKTAIVERDVSHLIFPDDVQNIPAESARPSGPAGRLALSAVQPGEVAIDSSLELLKKSKRPTIIVGYGAQSGINQIVKLAEKLNAPILTTFKAKGIVPDSHRNAAGVLGRSGTPIASWFMNESDLLLVFGASFSDHTGISPKKPTIQVDYERMQLAKFHSVTLPVWSDVGNFANRILIEIENTSSNYSFQNQLPEIADRWNIWRTEKRRRVADQSNLGLSAALLFQVLMEVIPKDAIIAVDVGNNTYSFGRYFEVEQQKVLMSGYLGSIGFGFPAAMGAWAATQDIELFSGKKVICISGDGGFGQYLAEFTTAVKYRMDITHILLNNNELGKISKEQRAGEWPVWQTDLHNPQFAAYAKLCGGYGKRVEHSEKLKDIMIEALQYNGPALVEVITDPLLV